MSYGLCFPGCAFIFPSKVPPFCLIMMYCHLCRFCSPCLRRTSRLSPLPCRHPRGGFLPVAGGFSSWRSRLAATVFVQEVKGPALAIVVPLLARGLKKKQQAMKRKAATIINMCQLVNDPSYVLPFIDRLVPGLKRAEEEMTDENVKRCSSRLASCFSRMWWLPRASTSPCTTRLSSSTW